MCTLLDQSSSFILQWHTVQLMDYSSNLIKVGIGGIYLCTHGSIIGTQHTCSLPANLKLFREYMYISIVQRISIYFYADTFKFIILSLHNFFFYRILTSFTQVTDCSTSSIATRVDRRTMSSYTPSDSGGSPRPFTTSASYQHCCEWK